MGGRRFTAAELASASGGRKGFAAKARATMLSARRRERETPLAEPLISAAMLTSGVIGTLTSMSADMSVRRALETIAKRQLTLGVLDPNHDIARAARSAQINTALVLLGQAQDAEPKTEFANGGYEVSPAVARPFSQAIAKLRRLSTQIERMSPASFERAVPAGGYAAVERAIQHLLSAEQSKPADPMHELSAATLTESLELGGWPHAPETLRLAFESFSSSFAASVGALLKSPSFDPFYRIWLVLKAEATNATVHSIRDTLGDTLARIEEKLADSCLIAGGQAKLAAFEDGLARIERHMLAIAEGVDDLKLDMVEVKTILARMERRGLTPDERAELEREIEEQKLQHGLKDRSIGNFLREILKEDIPPSQYDDAFAKVASEYSALVEELNRKTNLPYEVERERKAAQAAVEREDFEQARLHLQAVVTSTRREAEHAVDEYARSVAALGALAFSAFDYDEARRQYILAVGFAGISAANRERFGRSLQIATNAAMARSGSYKVARRLESEMRNAGVAPNVFTFSTLIKLAGDYPEGRRVFHEMIEAGVKPNVVTFSTLIGLADDYAEGRRVFREMLASGVKPDVYTFSTLIKLAGDYPEGRRVFQEMIAARVKPNVVTFSTLIDLADDYSEGRDVFEEMLAAGVAPNEFAKTALIAKTKTYEEALDALHYTVRRTGPPSDGEMALVVKRAPSFEAGCALAVEARQLHNWFTGRAFYEALFSLPTDHLSAAQLLAVLASLPFHFETGLQRPLRRFIDTGRMEEAFELCLHAPYLAAARKFYRDKPAIVRDLLDRLARQTPQHPNFHYLHGIASFETGNWDEARHHLEQARITAEAPPRLRSIDEMLATIPAPDRPG